MTTLLGAVTTTVVLLVLLAGCAAHLTRPTALPDALRAHRTLPGKAIPLAAAAVTLTEGALGAAGTAALLSGDRTSLTAVLAAATALFLSYAVYARHTLAAGRGGPCGCSRTEVPLSNWVVGRAWAFAALALIAAASTASGAAAPQNSTETATAALAAAAFAALLWVLPTAMAQPATPGPTRTIRTAATRPGRGHPPWTS